MIGQILGHYEVVEKIGQGGMGVVYRARDQRLERDVALKVLPAGALADTAARKRFRNEALALARLNHPNICSVYDFDTEGDADFLVMEFVPGISLHEKLEQSQAILDEVPGLGLQIAAGLAAAHEQGVIHRDLKPANLRVTPDGRLKILDFGLAKFFRPEAGLDATLSVADTSSISGTVPYMAPEQLRGDPVDARADIYATGVVLYELATGRRPFPEPQIAKLIDAILNSEAAPASRVNRDVSAGLDSVLRKALSHRVEDRYQSAQELRADLEKLGTSQTLSAEIGRPKPNYRAVVTALVALLLVGTAIGWYVGRKHNQEAAEESAANGGAKPTRVGNGHARRAVAVFAIKNVSGRADADWLSTALSEMLTTELSAGGKLRTIPGETVSRAKVDLSLADAETFGPETLRRINTRLGTDAVLSGTFVVVPGGNDGKIRVDLRVQDSHTAEILASVSESGAQSELLEVVARAGAKLRTSLGSPELSADDAGQVRASLPRSSDAAKLYAEGINKLRVFETQAGKDLLEKAVAADPTNAAFHTALASAWGQLGYDAKALEETKKALDLSANLSREAQFATEGSYQSALGNWPKAAEIYQSLFNVFPDNPDYGVQLAVAQSSAGKAQESFATIEKIRNTIPAVKEDARLDIAEAGTADRIGDFKREFTVATRAVERAKVHGEKLTAARGLLLSGWALHNLGEVDKATTQTLEAKQTYEAVGDRVGLSRALHNLALILTAQGKLDEAEAAFNQAITIRKLIQDNQGLSRALNDVAVIHERRGDFAAARKNYEESVAIAQKISDSGAVATAFANLANVDLAEGKTAEGKKAMEHALGLFRHIGNKNGVAACLANLGNLASDAGDFAGAQKFYDESANIFKEIGQKAGVSSITTLMGTLYYDQGNYDAARTSYERALAAGRDVGDPELIADAESGLSKTARQQGDWANARARAESALDGVKKAGDKRLQVVILFDYAAALDGTGDLAASKKALQEGLTTGRELGDKEMIAVGLHNLAEYQMVEGDLAGAQKGYEQEIAIHQERKSVAGKAEGQTALAMIFVELKQYAHAAQLAREAASDLQRTKNSKLEVDARIALAYAELGQRHLSLAKEALARASAEIAETASPNQRLALATCGARVSVASGNAAAAVTALQAALNSLGAKATLEVRIDARVALAEATLASGGAAAARPLLDAIEKDANDKGYVLYARKAVELRQR